MILLNEENYKYGPLGYMDILLLILLTATLIFLTFYSRMIFISHACRSVNKKQVKRSVPIIIFLLFLTGTQLAIPSAVQTFCSYDRVIHTQQGVSVTPKANAISTSEGPANFAGMGQDAPGLYCSVSVPFFLTKASQWEGRGEESDEHSSARASMRLLMIALSSITFLLIFRPLKINH